jgi:DNA repair protein RadC
LDDRPREKLLLRGTASLTDAELLAILIRTGTKGHSVVEIAQMLISEHKDLANVALLSVNELQKIKGVGKDKAVTLVAAFEIAKRVQMQNRWENKTKISSPDDIAELLIPMLKDEQKEKFLIARNIFTKKE